ncbi:uncharacterized protein LOC124926365 [Impatiens glandulifera]|uniref:uncharacterized protein LOC124926365 n=1 Tax=Impatiens glandulifera TaxID=253017 RepID=UPI001FB18BB3|nr:uncharacterized protein LOC124926365 [Impatiens glandulifera]
MLGTGGDIPTRHELLTMVKKHSKTLGKTDVGEEDASDVETNPRFWHDIMDMYFILGKESRGRQDDDLIFFVKKSNIHEHAPKDNQEDNNPYFVRRWAVKLNSLVDEDKIHVDWRRSFYLNLIAHTSFSVTVAICSHEVLKNHQGGRDSPLSSIYKVVKTVYASPSRVNFHLDSRKESETTPAYPDICFAVDDFDSTFDAVVLTETDHCYCVLLNADGGASFPSEDRVQGSSSSDISSLETSTNSARTKNSKLTMFSGFVSYQMVRDAYDAERHGFGSLLSLGNSSGKTDRIYMRGPGGRGEVEVAVSGVIDQSKQDHGPPSPDSKKGSGFSRMVRKAAAVASLAAKQAYAAAANNSDDEMLPLKCCLMSISLPWEHIANDLLFKGSPPVKL